MLRILLAGSILLTATPLLSQTDSHNSVEELFLQGNEKYEQRQFDSAIVCYATALVGGEESAPLYFNLGNAYFKSGDLGRAILYYLRAKRLESNDEDIINNLEFAQSFTSVQMAGVPLNPVADFLDKLVGPYHFNELAWLASLFFVSFFVLLSIRFGLERRGSLLKTLTVTSVSIAIVLSFLTTVKYRADFLSTRAVLIAEECPVRSGPNEQSELELQGAPGLVVDVLAESGDYYNVLFENKRRGWVRKDLVAVI